jgi:Na+(H+)/acetate symporter ActP
MQFIILLIGVLVFTFYQFHQAPVFFNKVETDRLENSAYKEEYKKIEQDYSVASDEKQKQVFNLVEALESEDKNAIDAARVRVQEADKKATEIRKQVPQLIEKSNPLADANDGNYIFLRFVTEHFPIGIIGLLIAIIFLAAMGSTSSGLNSLASTTVVDFYKRLLKKEDSEKQYVAASRWITVGWGLFCIVIGIYASKLGNLIEAVNILGSLFYGTILGIFLVAFYMKKIGGQAVFYAALVAEALIVYCWWSKLTAFLWLNVIGCVLVMTLAFLIQAFIDSRNTQINRTR